MSYEGAELILSSIILLAYSYYILASGTEKSFRFNKEKDKKLLIPIRVFLSATAITIILAVSIEAFKGIPMNKVYFITSMVLMLLILSNRMFAEGHNSGTEKAEGFAKKLLDKYRKEGGDE